MAKARRGVLAMVGEVTGAQAATFRKGMSGARAGGAVRKRRKKAGAKKRTTRAKRAAPKRAKRSARAAMVKGSAAAKRHMAKLRKMRRK